MNAYVREHVNIQSCLPGLLITGFILAWSFNRVSEQRYVRYYHHSISCYISVSISEESPNSTNFAVEALKRGIFLDARV